MPKRPATPPIDDGAKYLTVVYPYPSRPNMELESHRILFAQWVAACIDQHYLRAFYYRPTSPGSILLEIDDSLPDFKQILGAHKWSEFLAAPQEDDGKHVSKVFYCQYNSDRHIQKHGWKRVDPEDRWFTSKGLSRFASPYPQTRWCDIPKVGNVIQNDLCRPLPREFYPAPPAVPTPVVGTPEWVESRRQQEAQPPAVKRWPRGVPREALNSSAPSGESSPNPTIQAAQPAPHRGWADVAGGPAGVPPGLSQVHSAISSQGSSTSGPGSVQTNTPSIRSGSVLALQTSSSSTSTSGSDSLPASLTSGVNKHQMNIGIDVEGALNALSLDGEDDPEDDFYSIEGSTDTSHDALHVLCGNATTITGSLWDNYLNDEDEDEPEDNDQDLVKAAQKTPGLCRVHNRVCKKGICAIYAAQLRAEEKQRRAGERKQQREAHDVKAKKDAPTSPSQDGASTPARGIPPHLRAAAAPSGPVRQRPAHLMGGAAPATTTSPSPASTESPIPTPSVISGDDANVAPRRGVAASALQSPQRAWGTWGRAPSVSASSVERNKDSWSASGRSDDGDDARSVGSRSETSERGTKSDRDGPWGSTDAVRSAHPANNGARTKKADTRSVAGSTKTTSSWGNVSVGPW